MLQLQQVLLHFIYPMEIIKIKKNDVNIRLDNFIKKYFSNFSLNCIFKYIRIGKIKVNNKKVKFNYHLKLNDEIKCFFEKEKINIDMFFLKAKNILEIVYEDKNILIVNKPSKLLTVDEDNKIFDTLINRVKKYLFNTKK